MEPIDPILATAIGAALTGTIGALWLKLGRKEDEYNRMRDAMQIKHDALFEKALNAINAAANAANTFSAALTGMKEVVEDQEDKWQLLKRDIVDAIRN